jgi:hypothetical protein
MANGVGGEWLEAWQSIVVRVEARIQSVYVTEDTIFAELQDGRTMSVPLAWS